MTLGSPKAWDYTGRPTRPVGTHEPRAQWPRGQWAHRWWQIQTNLTRGRGRLHRACHRREGVKVQVQQTGLLREWPRGLKLGSSSRGGRQLVSRESTQHTHTQQAPMLRDVSTYTQSSAILARHWHTSPPTQAWHLPQSSAAGQLSARPMPSPPLLARWSLPYRLQRRLCLFAPCTTNSQDLTMPPRSAGNRPGWT